MVHLFLWGLSGDTVSAGISSNWTHVSVKPRYWENTNAKTSDWRSRITIGPARDYREGTVCVFNTATVKLAGEAKTYESPASI